MRVSLSGQLNAMTDSESRLWSKGIVTAGTALIIGGIGYGLSQVPAGWASLFHMMLAAVVLLLALLTYRLPALLGTGLSILVLFPDWIRAWQQGLASDLISGLVAGFLCLAAGVLFVPLVDLRRVRTRVKRRLSQAHHHKDLAHVLLDEALRTSGAQMGEVLYCPNGDGELERLAVQGTKNAGFMNAFASDEKDRTVTEWVLQEKRTYVSVPNTTAPVGAVLPLQEKDQVLGLLCVGQPSSGSFGRQELARLHAVAEEGAVVLAQAAPPLARMAPKKQRAKEQQVLDEISQAMGTHLDLRVALRAVLTSIQGFIPFDTAQVTLWDSERNCLVNRGFLDADGYRAGVGERVLLDEGYSGWLARNRRPLLVEDVLSNTAVQPDRGTPGALCRSYLGIPLQFRGEFIGTLEMTNDHPAAFSDRDLAQLEQIGLYAASTIEYARLYEESRRQDLEKDVLLRISATLNATLDLDQILPMIASSMLEVVGCQQSAVFVMDEKTETLHLAATYGLDKASAATELPVETGGPTRAVATGSPVIVEDLSIDSKLWSLAPVSDEGVVAFATYPLQTKERVVGMFSAFYTQAHRFTDSEHQLLATFADQAALAIANGQRHTQAERTLQRRAEALSGLQRVARELTVTFDQERVLRLVLEEALSISHAARCAILLRTPETNQWEIEFCAGYLEEEQARLRQQLRDLPEEDALNDMVQAGQVFYLADTARDGQTIVGQSDARSVLLVPIWYEGNAIGAVVLGGRTVDAFDVETRQFVETLTVQAGVAIENARLLQALEKRLDTLSTFDELSRSVTAELELDAVLESVAEAVTRLVNCWGSVVFLQDPATDQYLARAARGHNLDDLTHYTFSSDQGLVGHVVKSGMPLSVAEGEERTGEDDYVRQGAVILAPMNIRGQVVGVLAADRARDGVFSSIDVATLTALADQVAVAVQNARLFDETIHRTEELSTLLGAGSAISSSLDLNWVLQTLGDLLLGIAGADCCVISEWDREEGQVEVIWEVGERTDRTLVGLHYPSSERPLVSEVLLVQEPLLLREDDPQADESVQAYLDERGVYSALLLPMVARGRTIGLVELELQSAARAFEANEIRLVQALANQAAAAMQNARLYAEIRGFSADLEQRVEARTQELGEAMQDLTAERDRMEALYLIAAEVSASLDLDRVLNRTLGLLVKATGAEKGAILLENPETNRLMYRSAIGIEKRIPPGGVETRFRRGEGLAGWVMSNREHALIDDVREDERWLPDPEEDPMHRACLALPLGATGEIYGSLLLFSSVPGTFTEDHHRIGETAAAQIANAVGNAALYGLIQEQSGRLGAMLKNQQVEAAKSAAILEGVADGVIVADAQDQLILFNAAAERILETPREKVLGHSTREMFGLYGAEGRAWLETIREWAETPKDRTPEDFAAQRLELGDRVIGVHVSPVIMGSEYLGTVSVVRDITVEVEADRAKSEFVSMVSHELRTPMTSVKGYADLMLAGAVGDLSEQQHHFLSIIRNNANRLTELVNDLLDISRIETGRVDLDLRAIHIDELVDLVVNTLQGRAKDQQLALEAQVPQDLPAIWGDSSRVTQILTNLVGNAVNYTPPGGQVTVTARLVEDMMEVSVADTGVGIAKEDITKIFDRFFRADDPFVQEAPGTGLGLPITASLIEMHNGRIWVESEQGKGSVFSFTIPIVSKAQDAEFSVVPEGVAVLVVEDDEDVAKLIRFYLEAEGHQVAIVSRGEEVLQVAQETHPSLITLDLRLPDADGLVILERLKEKPETADIPVIIVSGVPERERGFGLGALDVVDKPLDEEVLLNAVRGVLQHRGLVLVVDDDPDNLSLMRETLHQQGFGVRTTGRGKEALQVAETERPSLILLDLKLGDIDGYEVLRKLGADSRTSDIPVIVMTGSLTQEELKQQKALELGAVRFLTKPFELDFVVKEVSAVLRETAQKHATDPSI